MARSAKRGTVLKGLVLVDGAGGFLGSHVVERLCEDGWRVRATDLPSSNLIPAEAAGAEVIPCDLLDIQQVKELLHGVRGDFVLDTSKIKALGFRPKNPFTMAGMARTIQWYRDQGWLPPPAV